MKRKTHAASSGFLAYPIPIAAISAARAAGKGLLVVLRCVDEFLDRSP